MTPETRRNLWHTAAEGWRDAGRHTLDDCRFLTTRRLPLPVPVLVALAAGVALVGWRLLIGG